MFRRIVCSALLASFALVPLAPVVGAPPVNDAFWQRTTWNDEPAWIAKQGEQAAIVSEARSRVIYLGSTDGKTNLLSAPFPKTAPTEKMTAPNWGGHRFWLGPQSRWSWPPLKEWEFSASTQAEAKQALLTLTEAQLNPDYPALVREYSWENGRLRCTVRWKGEGRPYYGMHVVAVDNPAQISPSLAVWEHVPQGLVGVRLDQPDVLDPLPHPGVKVADGVAHLEAGIAVAKLGFSPQTLSVVRGNWTLLMSPGPNQGIAIESPDFGYDSQVWIGDSRSHYSEIEQITPFLLPGPDGWCGSTIFLEARRNAAP